MNATCPMLMSMNKMHDQVLLAHVLWIRGCAKSLPLLLFVLLFPV